MVLFVGDKPSSKNTDPNVPFIGTPSHKVLMKWADTLGCSNFLLCNSFSEYDKVCIRNSMEKANKVIALGLLASERLKKMGIHHHLMPHPSPLNRKLNNPEYVNNMLKEAAEYINGSR